MARDSIYRRYQAAVTPETGKDSAAYWFVFRAGQLLVSDNHNSIIPFARNLEELGLLPVRKQYLGLFEGSPCYSAEASAEAVAPAGMCFRDLRPLYSDLDEDMFLLAGKAVQIVSWDQTHQYCGRCGNQMEILPDERAKKCPSCGLISYPRISPAVITAVFKGHKILLSHNIAFRGKIHSLIAGFVEPGETLEECARREILEEAGITVKNLRYFGSQPWPFPNSLMIGFTAEYDSGEITVDGKEISEAAWYEASNLPELPPRASIAREIIDWFVQSRSRTN